MSFFFTKKKAPQRVTAATAKSAEARVTRVAKQNADTLNRLSCSACPLNKIDVSTPKMKPTLAKKTKVYFLAAAPDSHEDEVSGQPLTGPLGQLLRGCIPEWAEPYCSFDNTIRDRPPRDRIPTWAEIECCRPLIVKSIEEAKPNLIVTLGPTPLSQMLGTADIQGYRGRLFAVKIGGHKCWLLPTYHPSLILSKAYDKKKPLQSRLGHCFKMDLKRAFDHIGEKPPRILTEAELKSNIQCFDGTGQFKELLTLIAQAKKAEVKAVDIETKGLRPFYADAAIMTVAISFENTHFAFALGHPKAGWSKEQKTLIMKEFEELLKDETFKIAHNDPFELEWFIWYFGMGVVRHEVWEDTMMQAHFIDERKGKQGKANDDPHASPYQKLDFLAKQYLGITYKGLFKLNKKDMSKSDLGETLIYNATDTKVTLEIWGIQNDELIRLKLYDAYQDALPRQPTVALMQHIGVDVDQKTIKGFQTKLGGEIKGITNKINDLKVVKAYIKDHKEFNPLGEDAIKLFRDYLKRKEVTIVEENNTRYSVDKNVLDKIDHPLAQLIVDLRNRSKLKSTYVDDFELGVGKTIFPDGKIHTSFNTTFTETGRLSSDSPNAQNWPKRKDAWVRASIVPPKNHLMVAVDYGQLEACTGAMCSLDEYLVKALWDDYDIHQVWALKAAKKVPGLIGGEELVEDKKVMKGFRSLIKNKLTFPAFFGASSESVRGYLVAATGYDVDQSDVDDLMDEFWDTFRGVKRWQDRTMKNYYDEGYVTTLVGRRHNYPLTRNQAINAPIQGGAAELVCDAMQRLSIMAAKNKTWYLHPVLNVHDDLTFFIPDDDKILDETLKVIMKEMLTFSYDFINVPLSIEISIGKNWAELEPLGKFFSHKEFGFPK